MHETDWFSLMRGITEMHVKSLKFDAPSSQERSGGDRLPSGPDNLEIRQAVSQERPITALVRTGQPRGASISLPDSPVSGNEGVGGINALQANGAHASRSRSNSDSPISDRFGDNRFADNILRALDGLPQNGDDEEERDAAEEGALIEASGYPDPQYERNGR